MKLRRRKKRIDKGAPKWMVTYSDMVTLVLVFFVLLFSMSQLDLAKFEALQESFRNQGIFDHNSSAVLEEDHNAGEDLENEQTDHEEDESEIDQQELEEDSLDELLEEVETFLDENQLNNVISATRTEEGVVLTLQEVILFNSAEAEILEKGKPFLEKVGVLLSNIPNDVRVEGHTDTRPIATHRYPSNWELSGARASSVIRHILNHNDLEEDRFIAAGYSDTRPVAENTTPENMSKNRRVEIVILELEQS
ncbi:flagellar motor protein MotS [Aquibacillus sediminis]|uniref:flagellar motor protein MotS n=1 Tax=Aquibacillus sediminis TaxID=2574734 RepID=UPI0011097F27|nr:flagellar motor protein MotS [Aquibacillus sediminis]